MIENREWYRGLQGHIRKDTKAYSWPSVVQSSALHHAAFKLVEPKDFSILSTSAETTGTTTELPNCLKQTFALSCKIKPSGKPITLLHSSGCKRRTRSPTRYIPVFAPIPPPNADKVTACPFILYTRSPCPPLPTAPIHNGRFSPRYGIVSLKLYSFT